MTGDFRESGRDGASGEPEPPLRGGGLPLPGLKHWRLRKGISQAELARRAGLSSDYLFKVESGRRACRPQAAELLAGLVGVSLEVLRRKPGGRIAKRVLNYGRRVRPKLSVPLLYAFRLDRARRAVQSWADGATNRGLPQAWL